MFGDAALALQVMVLRLSCGVRIASVFASPQETEAVYRCAHMLSDELWQEDFRPRSNFTGACSSR